MLSTLLLVSSLAFQPQDGAGAGSVPPSPAAAQAPALITRTFGQPGEKGAMEVTFHPAAGSILSVRLLDHFESTEAARRAEPRREDYLLVATDVQPGLTAFSLSQVPPATLFPMRLNGVPGNGQAAVPWQVEELPDGIRFALDSGSGLRLEKTFRHRPGQRGLGLELTLRHAPGGHAAGELLCDMTGLTLINTKDLSLFGNPAVAIAVEQAGARHVLHPAAGTQRVPLPFPAGAALSMAGTTNRFFGAFLFPLDEAAATAVRGIQVHSLPYDADDPRTHTPRGMAPLAIYRLALPVPAAGGASTVTFGLYVGPKSYSVFDESPEHARFDPIMDVDLEPPCCVTVPGGRFMASLLLKLLGWFHSVVGSWGVAIVMLTILVRGAMAPLNFKMQKSMRAYAAKMAVLKPKMDRLKQQHGDDQKAYQAAMLQLQREHKIMPPLGGCLPILLTMPIYLGLFAALRVAYDLRQQPFIGWIDDLSQPDALFHLGLDLGLFAVPTFNLLPLVWIGMFLFLQLRMPLPTDPQQRQMQMIMRYMPVLFGLMLYNYASGLMVYMVTSMIWTMFESAVTKRILGPIDPNVQAMAPTPVM